jgi:hypothetical protein
MMLTFFVCLESTPLSQCFAKQGVKIPIRKDTQVKRKKSTKQAFSVFANTMIGGIPDNNQDGDDNDDDDGSLLM